MSLLLALGFVAVAALLLNLNVASAQSASVKAGAIVVVSVLYGGTYLGVRALEGWPTEEPLPEEFRVHWIAVDEPDKRSGAPGAIYFWVRELDEAGLPRGEPRAHVLSFDEATAEAAREALETLQGGKPLNGELVFGDGDSEEDLTDVVANARDPGNRPSLGPTEPRPRFRFREVPPPDLPTKPPL